MTDTEFSELSDFIKDTFDLLVQDPKSIEIVVKRREDPPDIVVSIRGQSSQLAFIVGKHALTVRACDRIFHSIARRMGFRGDLVMRWLPIDAGEGEEWKHVRKEEREYETRRTG